MLLECSIIDENIQFPEFLHSTLDGLSAKLWIGNVTCDQERTSSFALDRAFGLLCITLLLGQIHDRNICTLACEQYSNRTPDPGIAAGNECHLALKLACGFIIRRFVLGLRLQF